MEVNDAEVQTAVSAHIDRWQTPTGLQLVAAAHRAFAAGNGSLENLPGQTDDGLVDLRGLPGRAGFQVRNQVLENLDLTGASLATWQFWDVEMRQCRFAHADLAATRWFDVRVESCTFDAARLSHAALATRPHINTWTRCTFARATLNATTFLGGLIEDCTFQAVRITDVNFDETQFIRTRFSGALNDVVFDAPRSGKDYQDADGLDLREAVLKDVQFLRYRLNGILLPPHSRFAVLDNPSRQLPRAIKILSGRHDLAAEQMRAVLRGEVESAYRPDQHVILHLDDLTESELDHDLIPVLTQAGARFLGPMNS